MQNLYLSFRDAIDHDERQARDDQLARAADRSNSARMRELFEPSHGPLDAVGKFRRERRILVMDAVER
jgi:hypothetical protein